MQYKSRWARGLVASLGLMAAAHAPAYAQGVAAKDSGKDGPDGRQYRVIAIHANGNANGSKPLIVLDRLDDGIRIEPFLSPWQYTESTGSAAVDAAGFKGYTAEKIMDRGSVIGYVLEPQDSPGAGRILYSFDNSRNGKAVMRVSQESLTQAGGAGGAGGDGGAGGGGAGGGY